jgi:hypothetical protein
LRTASISTGAYVLWSKFDLPMEFASLADKPTASVPPAVASTTPDRRMSIAGVSEGENQAIATAVDFGALMDRCSQAQ